MTYRVAYISTQNGLLRSFFSLLYLRTTQLRAENLLQAADDLIPDRRRVLIRQRLFVGLIRKAEHKAFLILQYIPIDLEPHGTTQFQKICFTGKNYP